MVAYNCLGSPSLPQVPWPWWDHPAMLEGAGVPPFTTVCYAGETQREVREPFCACTHHLLALTQPRRKWVLP